MDEIKFLVVDFVGLVRIHISALGREVKIFINLFLQYYECSDISREDDKFHVDYQTKRQEWYLDHFLS